MLNADELVAAQERLALDSGKPQHSMSKTKARARKTSTNNSDNRSARHNVQEMNASLADHKPETQDDYLRYDDEYFNGIRPLEGWRHEDAGLVAFRLHNSMTKYGSPADSYSASFTSSGDKYSMLLIVEREPDSTTLMGSQMRLISASGSATIISIPPKYSTSDIYQRMWSNEAQKLDNDHEPMKREVIVTNDGEVIHCETPMYGESANGLDKSIERL